MNQESSRHGAKEEVQPRRRSCKQGADIRLQATRAGCADIVAREGNEFQVWGVVTQVIKTMPV